MKKLLIAVLSLAIAALPAVVPRDPPTQEPAEPAKTTAAGLIVGLDGGTYQPYKPEVVSKVQAALAQKGFYKGEINGTLDKPTMTAIGEFQKQNGLTVSGVPSPSTRKALLTE